VADSSRIWVGPVQIFGSLGSAIFPWGAVGGAVPVVLNVARIVRHGFSFLFVLLPLTPRFLVRVPAVVWLVRAFIFPLSDGFVAFVCPF